MLYITHCHVRINLAKMNSQFNIKPVAKIYTIQTNSDIE